MLTTYPITRIPTALQWMFPTPLAVLMFLAPESPWWLVRKGKLEQATRSIERLGRKSQVNGAEGVAMMRRVIEAESQHNPSLIELFKGTDLRRTAIVCCIYAAQNLAGNLIANQAVFFFERELLGIPFETTSFVNLLLYRGWNGHRYRLRPGSGHVRFASRLCHGVLGAYNAFRTTAHLHLGNRFQRGHAHRSRYRGVLP